MSDRHVLITLPSGRVAKAKRLRVGEVMALREEAIKASLDADLTTTNGQQRLGLALRPLAARRMVVSLSPGPAEPRATPEETALCAPQVPVTDFDWDQDKGQIGIIRNAYPDDPEGEDWDQLCNVCAQIAMAGRAEGLEGPADPKAPRVTPHLLSCVTK